MYFSYKARTKDGKLQKGSLEASSYKSALFVLEKYGMFVVSIKEKNDEGIFGKNIFSKKISFKDITIFTRQLSVMLKSAISPVEALKSQVVQIENQSFREKILKMAEKIESGSSLSQVFSLFPEIFDQFYVSVIRSGESMGKVADSLNYLAEHLERDYNLRQKIKSAMIYPIFVIFVFIAVIFLATFFIIPKLTEVFSSFGGKLPLSTRMMIGLSDFVRNGGWIFFALIAFAGVFIPSMLKKSERFKKFFDKILIKMPLVGTLSKKIDLVRFAENLSVLISAGLPITQALKIIKDIMNNHIYKTIMAKTEEKVAKGEKISSVFIQYPKEIPSFVVQMVLVGERTGRLDEILMEVVKLYRQEIERTTDNLTVILEPVLILFLGIGIAIMAVSIFIPLFKIGIGGMAM